MDESYCRDCYYVVALTCPERQVMSLTDALDDVVSAVAAQHGISPEAEMHGHDLFQGKADWLALAPMVRARIDVYAGAFEAIAAHEVSIIIRGVRAARLGARYGVNAPHPHAVVLTHLLERVDEHAEQAGELAMVISDEPGQRDQQPEYRRNLVGYRRSGTRGYRARKLTQIVDTLYFAPSSASRMLQAADLVAFLYHRMQQSGRSDERAVQVNKGLWNRIAPRVAHCHCWLP